MLKSAVPSYNKKDLDDSIAQYKEAIKRASEAEGKIEKVKDYASAQSVADDTKKRNIDHLKTVRDVLSIIKKTIEKASLSYANAFTVVASSLSCSEFKQAVNTSLMKLLSNMPMKKRGTMLLVLLWILFLLV